MKKLSKDEMRKVMGGKQESACFECSTPVDQTVGTFYCSGVSDCATKAQQTCAGAPGNCTCNKA
jgi:hypothetical protein